MLKLTKSEELFARRPKPPELLALCLRYWLSSKITGDLYMLQRARHRAQGADNGNIELRLAAAFFLIELGEYDNALELLDQVGAFRNYFKTNLPEYHGIYLFLVALVDIRVGKYRAGEKHFKILSEYAEGKPGHIFPLLLGCIRLESGENIQGAWDYFAESHLQGGRSVFMYEAVYRYLSSGAPVEGAHRMLMAFINWSISQGIDISDILDSYMEDVMSASIEKSDALENIYAAYPNKILLTSICRNYIRRSDYSEKAYRYYHDADIKQLDIPILQQTLVRSAFHGSIEEVSRYTMEQFLKSGGIDNDERLKAYVYHVMLTSKKMRDFVPEYSDVILQFAAYCLENNLTGRYYNSIYKYFFEHADISGEYIDKAAGILLDNIFTYKVSVSNPNVRHIWVIEKEKRGMAVYETGGDITVRAASEHFSYVCFSAGVKNIIDEKIKIVKMVENADIGLYSRFYARGHRSPEIFIALARHYLFQDTLTSDAADTLNAAAEVKGISTAFKMQIYARLGNYFYDENNLDAAREYYRDVDENYLNDKYIERMLTVFINTGEYQKAAWLVAKKSHCIPERALFQALKKIARSAPSLAEHIAATAYNLLLKSWYDKLLVGIVINNYKASQAEWEELNKALNLISAPEEGLDELILYNAVWVRRPNAEAQKVFVRVRSQDPGNERAGVFAYYLVYEMLVNGMRPEYDTIAALELMFFEHDDSLLAYALSNLYLTHDITTIRSDEILERALMFMERDGLILSAFKESQDKKVRTPYIEKYQPFTYKGLPGKNMRLYYKAEGEEDYRFKTMEYFRFGIYYAIVPHFYGERLVYYFSEEMPTGSITTKEAEADNSHVYLDDDSRDRYFVINNALIYEHMFKYEKVEAIITESLGETRTFRARLL